MKLKFVAGILLACFTMFITSCQNDEVVEKDNLTKHTHQGGSTFVNAKEIFNLIKDNNIKKAISGNLLKTSNFKGIGSDSDLYDLYFEKFDLANYYSYTLYVSEYTSDHPYDLFFVVTIDKKDSLEKACYLKYTPDNGSIPFNIRKFTGKLEILDLEHQIQGVLPFDNGTASETNNVTVTEECTTTVLVTEVPCSHGGEHGVGETCNPPFINDAYYSISILTECHNNHTYNGPGTFIGGYGGGSGGGSSPTPYLTAKQIFTNSLTTAQQSYLNSNPIFANSIYYFLELRGYGNVTSMAKEIINAAMNNTLISPYPFFKYPPGSNYKTLYPELTMILSSDIPAMKNDEALIEIISSLTGLTPEQVTMHLVWGQGPEVNIVQLGVDENGNEYKGKFNPSTPDKIYIDVDLVNYLENYVVENGETNELALLRALVKISVLLHELVHYGDYEFDQIMQDNENIELGLIFEAQYAGVYFEFDENNNVILIKAN